MLGHRPHFRCYSYVCWVMNEVFKFQHLARWWNNVGEYYSPGEEENKYQEAGWRQEETRHRGCGVNYRHKNWELRDKLYELMRRYQKYHK